MEPPAATRRRNDKRREIRTGEFPNARSKNGRNPVGDVHVTRNAVLGVFPRHSAGVIDPVAYAHRTKRRRVCVFDLEVVMGGGNETSWGRKGAGETPGRLVWQEAV